LVDIHDPTGWGGGCTDEYPTANIYQIPFRILVPLEVDGLLVAGRCVSAQYEALGAIRSGPSSMAMGQAAGVAAALAARSGARPREVPVAELQRGLLSQDVYLGEELPTLLRSHR
jgi:succinate dehydrogenase/fumarate reductase flavoprotein subunit